jgi:hypothetical protein
VYIDRGASAGVQPGDRFTAVRPTRDIDSPRERVGDLGRHYLEIAQLEAVTVQNDFAMARVMNSCDGLGIGDALIPFAELTVPEPEAGREFSSTMRGSGEVTGAIAAALSLHMIMDSEFGAPPPARAPAGRRARAAPPGMASLSSWFPWTPSFQKLGPPGNPERFRPLPHVSVLRPLTERQLDGPAEA